MTSPIFCTCARLTKFNEWAVDHSSEVGPLEREFIEASKVLAFRELESVRRSNRRLRALFVSLMVLVLAVVTMAVLLLRAL